MTFNDNARIDTSKVQRRQGGVARGAAIGGGSILGVIGIFLVSQLFGVNLTPLMSMFGGGQDGSGTTGEQVVELDECSTGADANANDVCRMAAATDSIDTFWQGQLNGYRRPEVVLYSDQTQSACGTASNAVGPFYCPADESIYLDTAFFDLLRSDFNASGGPLAQMYVLAHEWGHHISHITGQMPAGSNQSGATSTSVRIELQADCYAGAWVADASTVADSSGVPFMQPVTNAEMRDALNAAASVGDDHIQQQAGQRVNPEGFTHGTSEQRQRWFATGYQHGVTACDTFSVSGSQL